MRTTKEMETTCKHYEVAIEAIEAIKAIVPTIAGKVANKRITDKITAAVVDGCGTLSQLGNFNVSTKFYDAGCIDIDFYDYGNTFHIRLNDYNNNFIKLGKIDAAGLQSILEVSKARHENWLQEETNAIKAMPAVCAFLQSVSQRAEELDNGAKIYISSVLDYYKINSFLKQENGEI